MPGPRWHIPYPIEGVEIVDVARVRTVEVGYRGNTKNKQPQEALMLTDDENIVDVQFAVQWTIKSPEDYLFNNNAPGRQRAAGRRDLDPRGRGQEQDGLRALRGPQRGRRAGEDAHAADPRPLPHRHPRHHREPAEHAGARAGAARVRGRRALAAGPRALQERGPGLRQRRGAEGARRGRPPDGGGQRLPPERDRHRAGRCRALPPDPHRVRARAGGDARAHVPRHDAADPLGHQQGDDRPEERPEPALPADRQAAARSPATHRRRPGGAAPPAPSDALRARRARPRSRRRAARIRRDALRSRDREAGR